MKMCDWIKKRLNAQRCKRQKQMEEEQDMIRQWYAYAMAQEEENI